MREHIEATKLMSHSAFIGRMIEGAKFDEWDIDTGTSGLCGMFALALYRALDDLGVEAHLSLLCETVNGEVLLNKADRPYWRHAAVRVDGEYFDIDGHQRQQWMVSNYCWNSRTGSPPRMVECSYREFIEVMRRTKASYDWRFYTKCRERLRAALSQISA